MSSPQQTGLPNSLLANVPDQLDLYVARAIEVADSDALHHEMILGSPAPRRVAGSERTPTPLRLFCLPFEDLLTATPRQGAKQKGRIARDSIAPIWIWLSQSLLPLEIKSYCRNFKAAIAGADHAKAKAHAADVCPVSGSAMRAALASESGRRTARQVLKSEVVLADAQEVALMLRIAPTVVTIHELLVRPVSALTEETLRSLRAIHDDLALSEPGAAPYVAVVAMNRLARPWDALQLARNTPDLVCEIIASDIQMVASAVRAAHRSNFDVDALLDNIAYFTAFHDGIFARNDVSGDGKLRRLLLRERAAFAEAINGFMRRAPAAMAVALQRSNADNVELALRTVRLVKGCRPFANIGFLGASIRQADEVMCRMLLSHNEYLFERNAWHRGPAEFATSVKITSALFGVEHGDFLRRRGRAALGAEVA
jgi:hypothetical protein